jgi:DNA-binding MarR family transcriptional regulator
LTYYPPNFLAYYPRNHYDVQSLNSRLPRNEIASKPFAENDLKILEAIARYSSISQRGLAKQSGLSLGMVNLILKRLVLTGYIQIQNLNRRKIRYFLTPQGLAAKYRRAHDYLSRTIRVYEAYRQGIKKIIEEQIHRGRTKFVIYGEGEIVDLVKVGIGDHSHAITYRVCATYEESVPHADEVILDCRIGKSTNPRGISILEEILGMRS